MDDYTPIYQGEGQTFNVDPLLVQAVSQVESTENPQAVSHDPKTGAPIAYGHMQLTPPNLQRLGVSNPYDPGQNIHAGTQMLDEALNASGGDLPTALKIYAGGTDQSQWGPNTNSYPAKVGQKYAALVKQQGQQPSTPASSAIDDFLTGKTASPAPSGSPSGASTPAAPQDNIDKFLTGQTGAPASPATTSTATASPTPSPTPTATQPGQGPSQAPTQPGWNTADFIPGVEHGAHALTDLPKEGLMSGAGYLANKLGYPNTWGPDTYASDQNLLSNYNRDYGTGHPMATLGSGLTQVGGTVAAWLLAVLARVLWPVGWLRRSLLWPPLLRASRAS